MHNGTFYINSELKNLLIFIELISGVILLGSSLGGYIRKVKRHKQGSFVFMVAGGVSFVLFSDVGAIAAAGQIGTFYHVLSFLSNYGYFFFNNFAIFAVSYYVFECIRRNGGTIGKAIHRCVDANIIFATVALLINNFIPYIFYFDDSNYYQRGNLFILSQIPAALGLVFLIFTVVKYRKFLTFPQRVTIISCIGLPVVAEVFQIVIYGFSWLALSMDIAAFMLVTQFLVSYNNNERLKEVATDKVTARNTRTRIVIVGIVSGLLFFSAVTKITVGVATDQVRTETNAHYRMLIKNASTQASLWLEEEYQLIEAQKNFIEVMDNYDQNYLTEYLTKLAEKYVDDEKIFDIYFVSEENEMSSGYGYVPDPEIDFTNKVWYKTACYKEGTVFNQPYIDDDGESFLVTLSTEIRDNNDRRRGVLAIDLLVGGLCDTLMNQEIPEDSYMIIIDAGHNVLYHPEKGLYVNNNKLLPDLYPQYINIRDYIHTLGLDPDNPTVEDYDGVKRTFYAEQIPLCKWFIIAAISEEKISVTERTLMESILVSLIVYLVMGVIIALWATNGVVQRLREARKEANAANEAKSSFLANMSHEIRTPINAVLGMDEILLRECEDENIREYALNIQSAGRSLLSVINEILDFSKIESGKLDIIVGEYMLSNLIGACKNLIELRAKDKYLQFKVERSEYLPTALIGDENRIRQVISNFLTNAVKYTKYGSVTLLVEFEKTDEKHGNLIISVKDTGMGITKESMEVLFNSFQRVDEDKNRNIEGTGLGLAITKQLVELMNGEIKVESKYGEGSVFTAIIPQIIHDASNIEQLEKIEVNAEDESATEDEIYKGKRFLAVDDVAMNLKVFKGLLKNTGAVIDTANSGIEAIALVNENKYDVVFLDHMMPGKDGVETFKELKANYPEKIKDVPVIMLTANAIGDAKSEYLNLGFTGYLSKPVSRAKLKECIDSLT